MRVTVIGGGVSSEHDVSLRSAAAVASALATRHEVDEFTIERDGGWSRTGQALSIAEVAQALQSTDVAFPALHGVGGEDGAIQGFLTTLGTRFVGCGVEASAVCMRKDLTKQVLTAHGMEVVEGVVVDDEASARAAFARFGAPVVTKPLADGSSVGVVVAHDADAVVAAAAERPVLVERYATGIEVDIGIVELDGALRIGTPLEIERSPGGVFDLAQKYGGTPPFVLPARLSAGQRRRLESASLAVFQALGCRGVARVDWFVDGDALRCNEVNTMPGMTAASQLPLMFADAGIPFDELVDGMVRSAVG
jgi:D-alanine-D-alanine ligase